MGKLPASYKTIDAVCPNCAFVFRKFEYDCPVEYYCANHAPPRPKCGSFGMEECYLNTKKYAELIDRRERQEITAEELGDAIDAMCEAEYTTWDAWAEGRAVDTNGTCAFFVASERFLTKVVREKLVASGKFDKEPKCTCKCEVKHKKDSTTWSGCTDPRCPVDHSVKLEDK